MLLKVDNLSFSYDETMVLKDVSLTVDVGEIVKLDGVNGAGKTTLLKCMTAILNQGKDVFVEGVAVAEHKGVLKDIAFVMAEDTLYDFLTVNENIAFFKVLFDEGDVFMQEVADFCKLLAIDGYGDTLVKHLSQGTRHKVYVVIMLSKKHKLLLMDEPFTALDKTMQGLLMDRILSYRDSKDQALMMVTHMAAFDDVFTRVVSLEKVDV